MFRIYDSTAEFKDYESAEKVFIDGYSYKNAIEIIEKLSLSGVDRRDESSPGVCQLVKYTLDENEKIKTIDTTQTNKNPRETDLDCFAPMYSRTKSGNYSQFGNTDSTIRRFTIDKNTLVFDIPSDKTNEDDFDIKSHLYFILDKAYDIAGYDAANLGMAKACIINTGGAENFGNFAEHDASFGIVSRKRYGLDLKDNDALYLYVVSGGKEKLFYVNENTKCVLIRNDGTELRMDDIRPGDIISVDANDKGEAKFVYKLFPEDTTTLIKDIDSYLYGYESYTEYILGYVEEKKGSGMIVNCAGKKIYCYLNSNATYALYNFEYKEAKSATANDIIASSDGQGASKVFLRVRNGDVKEVIIYE